MLKHDVIKICENVCDLSIAVMKAIGLCDDLLTHLVLINQIKTPISH